MALKGWARIVSQVLAHLASVPRLTAKLQCSLFRRQATGLMKDATAALQCVQAACTQARVVTIAPGSFPLLSTSSLQRAG